jgi:hypothetical protein
VSRLRQSASETPPGGTPTSRKCSAHGYGAAGASWIARRNGREWPRRFDHVFASQQLGAYACRYVDEWRTAGLSDQAAMGVDFAPESELRMNRS